MLRDVGFLVITNDTWASLLSIKNNVDNRQIEWQVGIGKTRYLYKEGRFAP